MWGPLSGQPVPLLSLLSAVLGMLAWSLEETSLECWLLYLPNVT